MKLAGVGDNVVDSYRDLGVMYPGGQALNVAVHARRLGIPSAYLGVLGDDRAGRHVLAALKAEGVDIPRLRIEHGPNAVAPVALIDGDRRFLGSDPGVSRFRLTSDDLTWLSDYDLIHSSESSYLEDQLALLARAAPLSFDFSERRDPAYIEPLLPHIRIAEFSLSGFDDEAAIDWLEWIHRLGPRMVLATRGTADALLFDGQRVWSQPTTPTEPVDTLGAGDAYIARFLVGILRGEPVETSLADAAVLAAATCGIYGAFGHGTAAVPAGTPDEGTPVVPNS